MVEAIKKLVIKGAPATGIAAPNSTIDKQIEE